MAVYPTTLARNPVNRVEVQLLVALAQEQSFSPWRHVVMADRFWVKGDNLFPKTKLKII